MLKSYFERRDDVMMAFLFGSHSKGQTHRTSDWDIAVYFRPTVEAIEWEEHHRDYPQEDRVWTDCIDLLKTDEVDLVVLNRAPVSIADTAIRGIPLVVKDHRLFIRFMLIVTAAAEDYRQFVKEYYEISQRSTSLKAQDQEDIRKTIEFLEEQLALYSYFVQFSNRDYIEDVHKRNDVERWIENIVNAAIDLAKIILGSEKRPIPDTYRETMRQAVWTLKIPEDLIEPFERWVRLRNILAHEYLDIKWKRIEDFIHQSESYFREFVKGVKRFLKENS